MCIVPGSGTGYAVLEKILESPLDCKEIQPVHSKGDQSWAFFGRNDTKSETPVVWAPHAKSWLTGKDPDAKRDLGQEEKGMREDEMVGWHHRLDGHELEWTPGVGDGQGGLACCNSWGHKRVGHNWVTELKIWKKTVDLIIFPSEKAFRCLYIVTYMPTYCIHKLFLKWYMKNC